MINRNFPKHGFNIAGCLFAISGVVWVLAGNISIGMMNVAIGVMFIAIGAAAKPKHHQGGNGAVKQPPSKTDGGST